MFIWSAKSTNIENLFEFVSRSHQIQLFKTVLLIFWTIHFQDDYLAPVLILVIILKRMRKKVKKMWSFWDIINLISFDTVSFSSKSSCEKRCKIFLHKYRSNSFRRKFLNVILSYCNKIRKIHWKHWHSLLFESIKYL